jgi:spermidine dehydrogenase
MKKFDQLLGMDRAITRRDLIHGAGLTALGLALPGLSAAAGDSPAAIDSRYYPPTLTGLRGSHPGSFETAHALAREGKYWQEASNSGDGRYDLVVVGGGISGLATAWFFRQAHGPDARILILDNHDDFGGHAKRNEFHQGGDMRLAWGGAINLEFPQFSDVVLGLLRELGVDIDRLLKGLEFNFGSIGDLGTSTYFDAETFGRDVLVKGTHLRYDGDRRKLTGLIDQFPIGPDARAAMVRFLSSDEDVLAAMSPQEKHAFVRGTSYQDFLIRHMGLPPEAAHIFLHSTDGYWGIGTDGMSIAEALAGGVPGGHRLGPFIDELFPDVDERFAMFPDGNASVARLLVQSLIADVSPAQNPGMDEIVTADIDYSLLDEPASKVRLRLNSTAVNVQNIEEDSTGPGAAVTYVRGGKAWRATASNCVLACYNEMVPFLCPELPKAQKEALQYQVRRPMLVSNVLMRNGRACQSLGIASAYCPGRLHANAFLVTGVNAGDYHPQFDPELPTVMQFFGAMNAPLQGLAAREQHQAGRARMLGMSFDDFERELRTTLGGMLGAGGFDPAEDILAITVNRWPHGYAYDYLDLFDPEWPPGQAPNQIARRRFGQVAIANSDAGADAYMHVAVDQAHRAVSDLVG